MNQPKAITEILAWQEKHAGTVHYSETASTRLAYDSAHLTSTTDCSGMVARMFRHFAGINVGTYTGNECNYGHLITKSKSHAAEGRGMLPGDVILFDWNGGRWDHIAIYAGHGRIWNHGGPGKGPLNWSLRNNVNAAVKVMVRRFLQPVPAPAHHTPVPPHPHPHPHPNPHPAPPRHAALHRAWPSYMRGGDYFGLKSGGSHSIGGANSHEQADVHAIKKRLMAMGYHHMSDNGIFGEGTKAAVADWQEKHFKSTTTNFGEVWHDDWVHLFTY